MHTFTHLVVLGLLATAASACQSQTEPPRAEDPAKAPALPANVKPYGARIEAAGTTAKLDKVLAQPAGFKDKTVVVEGEVRQACTRKGCWMELATSQDKSAPGCRVTFKDYGFFVPTNSAGAHARVEGVVNVETVSASHVEHMESEGATFKSKNPDGTASEVRLVANGVELKK